MFVGYRYGSKTTGSGMMLLESIVLGFGESIFRNLSFLGVGNERLFAISDNRK